MFTPERMQEVNLFVYEDVIQPVILALARLAVLQIEEEHDEPAPRRNRWDVIAAGYAGQERQLRAVIEQLDLALDGEHTPDGIDLEQDRVAIAKLLEQVGAEVDRWHQEQTAATRQLDELHFLAEQLRLLAPLDVQVERLTSLGALHLQIGTIPATSLSRIETSLFRIPFVIIPAFTRADRTLVFAATTRQYAPILDRTLHSLFFQPITLPPDLRGAPADLLAAIERQQGEAQQRLSAVQADRKRLIERWGAELPAAFERVRACRMLAETIQHLPLRGQVYVITGWTPARRLQELIAALPQIATGRAILEVLEPDPARPQVPTALRNPRLLRAFEPLVTNFGLPAYDELDPTLIVGLSFLLMYGLMFGDVGHGLVLALAGIGLRLRKTGLAGFSPLLILAGFSAALFGLGYGSVLGMPLLPALWLRPAEQITSILLVTLVAGAVLINLGFLLYLSTNWRGRHWRQLLLERNGIAGFAFYWALIGGGLALWQGWITPIVWLLLIAVPLGVLALREPLTNRLEEGRFHPQGNWGEYAVLAFFELFETVISFAGNSLSFVRLGAFAVAHEGLSRVVLLIADLSGGFGWLVMLIGTIFIVGFEGLIVGIQTLRLEYYEFFGRFFRGDGRPFEPLRIEPGRRT